MSVEAPEPAPQLAPAPLPSAPLPLRPAAAWAWSALILLGTLFLGFGLTVLAAQVSSGTIPPGALGFGGASVTPAEEWAVDGQTRTSITLEKEGVTVRFSAVESQESTATRRLLALQGQLRSEYPQLTVSTDPTRFTTDQGVPGVLAALAGISQTALAASLVSDGLAVDTTAIGASTQFGESVADIEAMLASIRIRTVTDG